MRFAFGLAISSLCLAGTSLPGCSRSDAARSQSGTGAGAPSASARERAIPVTTAQVERRDVPIYLDGLGSVIAYRTVTVRTQVDGVLEKVLFSEGQSVRKGDALAQIDARPFLNQLHQAQGQLKRDEALLETNHRNLLRYDELAKRKLIAEQQVDDQRGLVGQNEGTVLLDQSAVDSAKLNIQYARITAPIDGIVGIRNVDPGNVVHASDAAGIVVLTQLDPIAVIFTLPQDVLTDVARFQNQGQLEVVVFSRDGASDLGHGRLEVIDNEINAATATLRLKAVLPNPTRALWPNQFVKARLLLTLRRGATVLPAPAIQRGPDGPFVYVVNAQQAVQPRPVVVDLLLGNDAILAKGVEPGEVVVTEGQNQLRPGSRISVRTAAGASPETAASAGQPENGRRAGRDAGNEPPRGAPGRP